MTLEKSGFSFHFEKPKGPKEKPIKEEAPLDPRVKKSDYPIIGNAGFSVPYLVTRHDDRSKLKWMREHWHYFNIHRFNKKMEEPHFGLLSDVNILHLRKRGDWWAIMGRIRLSPSLFEPPDERYANHVLLHEMAHQWVSQILHDDRDNSVHGPKWKDTMVMVGLTPNQYDFTHNKAFMNKVQLEEQKKRDNTINEIVSKPIPFKAYSYFHKGKYIPVMYVGKSKEDPRQPFVIILNVNPGNEKQYHIIHGLYDLPDKKLAAKIEHNVEWIAKAKSIRKLIGSDLIK